jgi:glycosyltransferase involved in cell wall biosynthesis
MKILQVISSFNPNGAERLLANCLIAFKQLPVRMELLILSKPSNQSLIQLLSENQIPVRCLEYRSHIDPRAFLFLRNYVNKKKFDIVHSHLFPAAYFVAFCKSNKTKLITTEHSTFNQRRNIKFFNCVERMIYTRYDTIICISTTVKSELDKWIPSISSKTKVISNGIPLKPFFKAVPYRRNRYGIQENVFLVAMVSRIDKPAKDHETLIRSLVFLPSVHLAIIGTGKHESDARMLVKNLDLNDRVHFLGHQTEVGPFIKMADAVIHSCNYEGFGLAIVEAMACGKPVIATNLPSLKEIIAEGKNGLLFSKNNARDLAYKIRYLINNPSIAGKIAKTAQSDVSKYSIETTVQRLFQAYNTILH